MDKENFNFRPNLDPLKSVSIYTVFVEPTTGHRFVSNCEKVYRAIDNVNEMLKKETNLAEDEAKLIEQFRKYKERIKAE